MNRSAALLALIVLAGAARAEGKRKVAVLEYRAGTRALPGMAARLAGILEKTAALEVQGPEDARRTDGTVDSALARCAGDAHCVAGLGRKLGVQEVILVGVSELGDVILGLQRIQSSDAHVLARVAESLSPDAAPDDAALIGYLRRLLPASDFRRFGTIRVRAIHGAQVRVAGELRGTTPINDLKVPAPASYSVVVSKPGYVDFTARVMVPPDGVVEVVPRMVPRGGGGGGTRWYGRWYVWAAVGTVAAATAVVVVESSRKDPTSKPGAIKGWP